MNWHNDCNRLKHNNIFNKRRNVYTLDKWNCFRLNGENVLKLYIHLVDVLYTVPQVIMMISSFYQILL